MDTGDIDFWGLAFGATLAAIGIGSAVRSRKSVLLLLSFLLLTALGISQGLSALQVPRPDILPRNWWLLLGSILLGIAGGILEQRNRQGVGK